MRRLLSPAPVSAVGLACAGRLWGHAERACNVFQACRSRYSGHRARHPSDSPLFNDIRTSVACRVMPVFEKIARRYGRAVFLLIASASTVSAGVRSNGLRTTSCGVCDLRSASRMKIARRPARIVPGPLAQPYRPDQHVERGLPDGRDTAIACATDSVMTPVRSARTWRISFCRLRSSSGYDASGVPPRTRGPSHSAKISSEAKCGWSDAFCKVIVNFLAARVV
ncbi:hypothetical protein BSE24067_03072 [Burkholderia seminalis]|nr:hypothetical protein BSE24067_03072 [Burkholderia seminalis]